MKKGEYIFANVKLMKGNPLKLNCIVTMLARAKRFCLPLNGGG